MNTLLIPLIGPMQSWGSRSRFDDRDTQLAPTKSAVIGLLCAALGRRREEEISDLTTMRFGVRIDAPGRAFRDFQTAQNVIKADGTGKTSVTSSRHYLAGARFIAGFESDNLCLLREVEQALRSPKFTLCLGRKSFPLTVPPYFPKGSIREHRPLETALQQEPWRYLDEIELPAKPRRLPVLFEAENGEILISDLPISFSQRTFRQRRLTLEYVEVSNEVEKWCTCPN
ncbi:type I-E CRISPR-associated protein Cas5/CasD [Heliobacterium undosum]|uniref:Type I-E CRISPR-associated protein Cas5/CasD n=1 Tax=Heliomicrobium undosum TaxID=121734 RepID=A0A845L566_9FIRM|nr:type I-E CRISPR-associated protein Cas5/CasD [Heliomicrobium undosum]MZP30369.1 type I-E CRISPR-associated protein Cas5/CasD [Heliomicrobium undosum]